MSGKWEAFEESVRAARHQEALDQLANMRRILKDARQADRKAAPQARTQGGTFHTDTNDHARLLSHLVTGHGMAILPAFRTSTRNAQAAHLVAHDVRGSDHLVEDMKGDVAGHEFHGNQYGGGSGGEGDRTTLSQHMEMARTGLHVGDPQSAAESIQKALAMNAKAGRGVGAADEHPSQRHLMMAGYHAREAFAAIRGMRGPAVDAHLAAAKESLANAARAAR